VGHKILK